MVNSGVLHARSSTRTLTLMTEWEARMHDPCNGWGCGDQEQLSVWETPR